MKGNVQWVMKEGGREGEREIRVEYKVTLKDITARMGRYKQGTKFEIDSVLVISYQFIVTVTVETDIVWMTFLNFFFLIFTCWVRVSWGLLFLLINFYINYSINLRTHFVSNVRERASWRAFNISLFNNIVDSVNYIDPMNFISFNFISFSRYYFKVSVFTLFDLILSYFFFG